MKTAKKPKSQFQLPKLKQLPDMYIAMNPSSNIRKLFISVFMLNSFVVAIHRYKLIILQTGFH